MADEQIEGLPQGATVRPVKPQPATDASQIEGLPEGATLRAVTPPASDIEGLPEGAKVVDGDPSVNPPTKHAVKTAPTKAPYAGVTVPLASSPSLEDNDAGVVGKVVNAADSVGRYGKGVLQGLGLPSSKDEYTAEAEEIRHPSTRSVLETLGGPAVKVGEQAYETGKNYLRGLWDTGKEAYEAGQNIAEGQPVLQNLAKPASKFVETNVGAVPFIGAPTVEAGHKIVNKDYAGAAGNLTGVIGQVVAPHVAGEHVGTEVPTTETKAREALAKRMEESRKEYDEAKAKIDNYKNSKLAPPEDVQKEYQKAKNRFVEDSMHHDDALEAEKKAKLARTTKPAPSAPEVPTEQIEAKPKPAAPTVDPKVAEAERRKEYERTHPSPAHATTAVSQPPVDKPLAPLGQKELADKQGTVGMPKLLPEHELEVNPEPAAEQPKQEVLPPEKPKAKPERGNLRALTVDDTGKVIDKEEATTEGKLGRLLQESLQTDKSNPNFPAIKVTSEEVPREPVRTAEPPAKVEDVKKPEQKTSGSVPDWFLQKHKEATAEYNRAVSNLEIAEKYGTPEQVKELKKKVDEADSNMGGTSMPQAAWQSPKIREWLTKKWSPEGAAKLPEDKTSYEPKKEELVATGEEGREQPKSAAEYHPAVEEQVSHLSDENLRKLAKAHGLSPDEYDFTKRDEKRHRTDRDQLVKDIAAQISDDEKVNIGRNAERIAHSADTAQKAKAERAASLFPRLRGPVDEFGNPKVSGGAPSTDEAVSKAQKEIEDKFPVNPKNKGAATEPKELASMKDGEPEATFTVAKREGRLRLKGIQSINPKTGAGSRLLKSILDIADKHGVTMELTASPYGDEATRLNSDELKTWYGRHGFVPEEGHDPALGYMVREPKGIGAKGAPIDEFGNPTVGGGAPEGAAAPAEDEEAKRFKEHVAKTSTKDTDHVQQALKELGSDAKLSDVMKRAQELKDSAAKPVDLAKVASEHNRAEGLPEVKKEMAEKDPRSAEIARAYEEAKHNPNDPEVKKSYAAMIDDAKKQWNMLEKAGIKIEPQDEDPYKSYEEMRDDLKNNKRLKVFRGGNPLPEDHPLAQVDPKTGETYNTMFRAVHDAFGHTMHDNDFSEKGEENAWRAHRQMMSKEAIPAMTSETRGQVSAFFNKEVPGFPDQKAVILPDRFNEPSPDPKQVLEHIRSGKDFALLTAENPGNERATPEQNAKRNAEMKAELERMGYKPVPVEGHVADVQGQKENSFYVPDIKPEDAEKISKKFGQASVMTKVGIHDLEKGEIHPAGKMIEGPEATKQDYYSSVGGKAFSIPVNFDATLDSKIGKWQAPPELGAFSAEDKGQNIRSENERRMGGPLKRGEVERRGGEDRRGVDRTQQKAKDELFNRARRELGEDASSEEVAKLADHLERLPKPTAENSRLSDEELLKKGYSQEDLDAGRHLPSVSGGSQSATAKGKKIPTGDELIEKYGESSGDPAHTVFILKDGRGVANSGVDHDVMLGGKATDKAPPREKFVADGNIRVRPRLGGGREVSFSLPEKGINAKQLDYLMKMAPQLRSGAVLMEVGKPGGEYRILSHGEATDEALQKTIRDLVPVLNDKGAPVDEFGNPTASGGSQSATAPAKIKPKTETPETLREQLPDLAQEHLTEAEKEGLTTTATGKARTAGMQKFLKNMEEIPSVQEAMDIAQLGEGGRKWYKRSAGAFDAMKAEAPEYFSEPGDKKRFMNVLDMFTGTLAGDSPQQAVRSNMRETLAFWKDWHDAGRPELTEERWKAFEKEAETAWKDDGSPRARGLAKGASQKWEYAPKGEEWKNENMLLKNLTIPNTKVPNIIKALNGEDMWPDLTKNQAFKAPSFAENLRKWLGGKMKDTKFVTNDSWMGLFFDVDKTALSKPENYHPLSVITREAAKQLGWEPEEAQAAIWSAVQALTEKGTEDPEVIRHYSEDYRDIMETDLDTRDLLERMGTNLDKLDARLAKIEDKPKIESRPSPTSADSVRKLRARIEDARGRGAIPEPKSIQGSLFRENPSFEQRSNRDPGAGHTRTAPSELELIKQEEQAQADYERLKAEKDKERTFNVPKGDLLKDSGTDFNPQELDEENNLKKFGEKKKHGLKKIKS